MSAAHIYSSELLKKKLGYPLWEPDPGTSPSVEIADVGYILEGAAFVRLFNASKDEADIINEFGVPTAYTPLVIGPVHRKTPLPLDPISSESVNGRVVGGNLEAGPWVRIGGGFNFCCETQRGAALVLGDVGYREDALRLQHFIEYARAYQQSWLRFANNPDNARGLALDDLILVTGWVKTSAWACAAFSDRSRNCSITFQAGQALAEGGVVWGSWEDTHAVDKHSGPSRLIPPDSSQVDASSVTREHQTQPIADLPQQTQHATQSSKFNQCVFLRGFKCCDRLTYVLRKVRVANTVSDGFKSVYPRLMGSSVVGTSSTDKAAKSTSVNNSTTMPPPISDQLERENAILDVSIASQNVLETHQSIGAGVLDVVGDDELDQFLQLNADREPSVLDHLLYYILEVSTAQLAIIHNDDLDYLLQDDTNVLEFEHWIHALSPAVHVDENNVGMLDITYNILYPGHGVVCQPDSRESISPILSSHGNDGPSPSLPLSGTHLSLRTINVAPPQPPHIMSINPSPDHTTSFEKKRKEYFVNLLCNKWACSTPGHTVCVPTQDGRHRQISEQDLDEWVKALCTGETTTAQPPESIIKDVYIAASSLGDGGVLKASPGSVSPAHSRSRALSRSFSFKSLYGSSHVSSSSSGVAGMGYYAGKALKWIGEKTSNVVEDVIIYKRCGEHRRCLRRWQADDGVQATTTSWAEKRVIIFPLLEDALELSRDHYSPRWNRAAYRIGREVQKWLKLHPSGPLTPETATWLALVQICLVPLLLSRLLRKDPRASDLSQEILDVLCRTPLHLHDSESISPAICILVRELTYSPHTFQHSWLGVNLRSTIVTIIRARPLTPEELNAVHDMAARRLDQTESQELESCRPWEVAIFADCAAQDQHLRNIVFERHGVDSVLSALHKMLDNPPLDRELDWEPLSLIVRSLAFLSEHAEVTQIMTEKAIILLLKVVRLRVPKMWLCVWFWAMVTIRNVARHHPSTLDTLIIENARDAFTHVLSASMSRGTTVSSASLAEYRKEVDDCASNLLELIARRTASPNRGSEETGTRIGDIPSSLSVSCPPDYDEVSTLLSVDSSLDIYEYPWEARSAGLSRESRNTVVADNHPIAPKLAALDPLAVHKDILPEEPQETRWDIDTIEFPWAVGSTFSIEETGLQ